MENNFPHRKRLRYADFDYSNDGYYFITACVKNRTNLFGAVSKHRMILNEWGRIVDFCWNDLPNHYGNCVLDSHVVMPNHFHGIIIIENNPSCEKKYSLSEIIRGFKTFSSRRINELPIIGDKFHWQKSFYDRIIRNEKELNNIRRYIEQNPLKWEIEK